MGCNKSQIYLEGPSPVSSGVCFRLFYKDADTINIAGDFNNWNTLMHPLSEDQAGCWSIVIPLPKGRYQYQFIINQEIWITDPGAEMFAEDGFGSKNSLFIAD
ncbi:isoamylase early set domain-containing protein [bacterium]|nr:isoamylase early set domain-containing protein [bacterium]